jgi:hypothetical protein
MMDVMPRQLDPVALAESLLSIFGVFRGADENC